MFYLVNRTENIASQTALRDCSEEAREEPGYKGDFAT